MSDNPTYRQLPNLFRPASSAVFFVGVWLMWWLLFPQALGFREQNQLFLYDAAFLSERLSVAGGLADLISEFITQFNVITPLGAALYALLLTLIQVEIYALSGRGKGPVGYALSFIPSLLLLIHLGDIYTTLSLPVAIAMALALCILYEAHKSKILTATAIPALMWLAGPAAWIFVTYVIANGKSLRSLAWVLWAAAFICLQQFLILPQYPPKQTLLGINYFALPLVHPVLETASIVSAVAVPLLCSLLPRHTESGAAIGAAAFILLIGASCFAFRTSYDKDTYEIIAYDQLVRGEKWDEIVHRAEKYQPVSDIGCVSVNLAVFMSGRLDRLDDFLQCGTRGLLMPRVRDLISNVSTGEAFWRLGMINESLRYAFDSQESIPNLRKSPRFLMRMAQCQMLNGRYKLAEKYLDILSHTLFYRKWATEQKEFLYDEDALASDPVYGYLLSIRQDEDYLFHYPEMDKMLARLYFHNRNNVMAAWYWKAWIYLNDKYRK